MRIFLTWSSGAHHSEWIRRSAARRTQGWLHSTSPRRAVAHALIKYEVELMASDLASRRSVLSVPGVVGRWACSCGTCTIYSAISGRPAAGVVSKPHAFVPRMNRKVPCSPHNGDLPRATCSR
jgi:hypothetical protein